MALVGKANLIIPRPTQVTLPVVFSEVSLSTVECNTQGTEWGKEEAGAREGGDLDEDTSQPAAERNPHPVTSQACHLCLLQSTGLRLVDRVSPSCPSPRILT
jgi:hypothetical protein